MVKSPALIRSILPALITAAFSAIVAGQGAPPASTPNKLVYADFERVENNRPVTTRGGLIQLVTYEESRVHKSTVKGLAGAEPPAPELVRISPNDPNRAMKFDYALLAPNQWAGATVELHGLPDVDGQPVPEDVSAYKTLSLQVYATGVPIMRIETISGERGRDMRQQYPQTTFKVLPGMNTYKVPMTAFTQPAWVQERRVDPKEIFRKLTSINLTAFCDQCEATRQGMVIVDNVIFER